VQLRRRKVLKTPSGRWCRPRNRRHRPAAVRVCTVGGP